MNVSAAHVKDRFLDPAMDARALNLNQAFRLTNRTPECDSLLEHLGHIRPDGAGERFHLQQAHALAVVVVAENETEGQIEQRMARSADTLTRDLRGVELNGISGVLKPKLVARRLRGPLGCMVALDRGEGMPSGELLAAVAAIHDVFRRVPSAQLLGASVECELRATLFGKLRELHARHTSAVSREDDSVERSAPEGQLAPGTLLPEAAS